VIVVYRKKKVVKDEPLRKLRTWEEHQGRPKRNALRITNLNALLFLFFLELSLAHQPGKKMLRVPEIINLYKYKFWLV